MHNVYSLWGEERGEKTTTGFKWEPKVCIKRGGNQALDTVQNSRATNMEVYDSHKQTCTQHTCRHTHMHSQVITD